MSPGTYYSKSRPILSSFLSETLSASEDMNSLWFCSLRTIICSTRDTQFVSWSLIESRQALLYWLWSGPCLLVFRDYFVPWQSSKSILLLNEAEQMSFGKMKLQQHWRWNKEKFQPYIKRKQIPGYHEYWVGIREVGSCSESQIVWGISSSRVLSLFCINALYHWHFKGLVSLPTLLSFTYSSHMSVSTCWTCLMCV